MDKELKIQAENALNAYKNADENGKKMLEALFGKETFMPQDIKERVKTFADACAILGINHDEWLKENETEKMDDDVLAFLKLRIITQALNEGWKPIFDGETCRFYPWFYVYSKKEYEELDEEEKKECRVVGRSHHSASAIGGVACAYANSAASFSGTGSGSRLAFKNRELAEYCGKQFIEIWENYLFG